MREKGGCLYTSSQESFGFDELQGITPCLALLAYVWLLRESPPGKGMQMLAAASQTVCNEVYLMTYLSM